MPWRVVASHAFVAAAPLVALRSCSSSSTCALSGSTTDQEDVAYLVRNSLTSEASMGESRAGRPGNALLKGLGAEDRLHKLNTSLDNLLQSNQGNHFDKIDAVLNNIKAHDDILRRKVDSKLIADVIESLDERALKQRIRELNDELLMSSKWESARMDDVTKLAQDSGREVQIQITKSVRAFFDRQLKQDLKRVKQSGQHQREAAGARLDFSAKARRKAYLQDQLERMKADSESVARCRVSDIRVAEERGSSADVEEMTNTAAAKAGARQVPMGENEGDMAILKATYGRYAVLEKKSRDLLDLSCAFSDLDTQLHSGLPIGNALQVTSTNAVACEFGGIITRAAATALISAGARDEPLPTRAQLHGTFEAVVKPAARTALYVPTDQIGAVGQIIGRVRSAVPDALLGLVSFFRKGGGEETAEGALRCASSMLKRGDLAAAVEAAKKLELGSAASAPLADWIDDATARLAAEEAAVLLFAHGSVLNSRMVAH